ncbi:MAG: YhjD/YihY/BrkB family envelope integrity protein [Chromatocurvus sp.]
MISVPDKWQPLLHRLDYFLQRYHADRCKDTAAALTYVSLFALVPLLTVLYAMASAIPAFKGLEGNIQDMLFEYVIPEGSQDMQAYLDDFSRQAKNLTGFGVAFLVGTAILMLRKIEKSFTCIYGAFAAVPLFLLWVFISWNIVLVCAILVHGLSAYQSRDQAARPLVVKALEALHLLWRRQQAGLPLREFDLMLDRSCNIDSDSWSELRSIFLQHNLISQNDRGHYLLARDLHNVSLWQVVQWVSGEKRMHDDPGSGNAWEEKAIALLSEQEQARKNALDINLVELFTV